MSANQRIKDLIKSKGMTQKAFARSIGIAPESLSRILATGNVSENVISAVVKTYGIKREWLEELSDELFTLTNNNQQPNPPDMITQEKLRKHDNEIDDLKSRLRIIEHHLSSMDEMLNEIKDTVNRLSATVEKKRNTA